MLIDSCLDNIPNHILGFYWLPEGIHYKADMVRANFYWEGSGGKISIIWSSGLVCVDQNIWEGWVLLTVEPGILLFSPNG